MFERSGKCSQLMQQTRKSDARVPEEMVLTIVAHMTSCLIRTLSGERCCCCGFGN
jgi:hypothetical protein